MAILITERTYTGQLVPETCISCGIHFGLPADFKQNLQRHKQTFYCPSGHSMVYRDTIEQQLQRQLESTRDDLARSRGQLAEERKRHSSTKGQLTRTRKRADAGVCLHCHRTFANVRRHMITKHPGNA